jgi:cleavage and polyadenylation specificity factor subunit 2
LRTQFEDYEIAQVSGRIASTSDSNVPLLDVLASSSSHVAVSRPSVATSDVKVEEMEDVKPASPSKPHRSLSARVQRQPLTLPTSLFIGDLRLLTLKSTLASSGIPAEFVGEGVLVCGPGVPALLASSANGETPSAGNGGVVAVRKEADGRVSIEGNVGDEYYRIRDAVYESFAQVVVAA